MVTKKVTHVLGLPPESIFKRTRSNIQSDVRKIFAYIANRQFDIPVASIARFIDNASSTVSRMIVKGQELVHDMEISLFH